MCAVDLFLGALAHLLQPAANLDTARGMLRLSGGAQHRLEEDIIRRPERAARKIADRCVTLADHALQGVRIHEECPQRAQADGLRQQPYLAQRQRLRLSAGGAQRHEARLRQRLFPRLPQPPRHERDARRSATGRQFLPPARPGQVQADHAQTALPRLQRPHGLFQLAQMSLHMQKAPSLQRADARQARPAVDVQLQRLRPDLLRRAQILPLGTHTNPSFSVATDAMRAVACQSASAGRKASRISAPPATRRRPVIGRNACRALLRYGMGGRRFSSLSMNPMDAFHTREETRMLYKTPSHEGAAFAKRGYGD